MKNALLDQAKHYHSLGLNVFCIGSRENIFNCDDNNLLKAPNHEWHQFIDIRQNHEYLTTLDWENAVGLGIILGYKNICAIDIDGVNDFAIVENIIKFLGLPDKYQWILKSGSHTGYHIIFQCNDIGEDHSDPDEMIRFGLGDTNAYYPNLDDRVFYKIEFKWRGNIVLPNSLHLSGNSYEFINNRPESFPEIVSFNKIRGVKYYYGSMQVVGSYIQYMDSDITISKAVAKQDEEFMQFENLRLQEFIIVFPICYKITGLESLVNNKYLYMIQLSWFILDKNFNVVKRKIFNYFSTDKELKYSEISMSYKESLQITVNKRKVLLEFLFDLDHAKKIISRDNQSIEFIKKEIIRAGLYLDNFKKTSEKILNDLKMLNLEDKEMIVLNENNHSSNLSIHSLYIQLLTDNNINYNVDKLSDREIRSLFIEWQLNF